MGPTGPGTAAGAADPDRLVQSERAITAAVLHGARSAAPGAVFTAMVEVLLHNGIRFEELTELSHHSLIQYRLPSTGELIPLLQITPSKTDQARLLVTSPELADVLSTIIGRIRGNKPDIPLVVSYDKNERVYNPPMPLLFQWRRRLEIRAVSETSLRQCLDHALTATGITDRTGSPLRYTFHDFRRLFITDAIMHGTPSHIAQLVAGHRDINTTMGYKAVYPDTALMRTIDLGVDARKALSHSQFEVFAAWRHRRTDSVVRTCRQEAIRLAESIIALDAELIDNRKARDATVEDVAPELCEMPGLGSVAAACILTARSHPGRVRSETAFAALAGTCP